VAGGAVTLNVYEIDGRYPANRSAINNKQKRNEAETINGENALRKCKVS